MATGATASRAGEQLSLDCATRRDEPALQRLMASNYVGSWIILSQRRSPSYFDDAATLGPFRQVLVVRRSLDGALMGMGSRSIRPRFLNGRVESVGYLTDLRIDRHQTGSWIGLRLFGLLRQLHADGRAPGYFAVVAEDNTAARRLFAVRATRILPRFRDLGRLRTLGLFPSQRLRPSRNLVIRPARPRDVEAVLDGLRQFAATRQLAAVYQAADFEPGAPTTRGFRLDDLLLAWRRDRLVGTLGLWDRSTGRQTVVEAYRGALRLLGPVYNRAAPALSLPRLPAAGECLAGLYASFLSVADDDPTVFDALLRAGRAAAAERGASLLLLGLMQDDPLLATACRHLHVTYQSRLYAVGYDSAPGFAERFDHRPALVDLATL